MVSYPFFFPIKIRLRDVDFVKSVNLLDALMDPVNYAALWVGAPFTRKVVVIGLSKGLFRRIVLGPPDAEEVAAMISQGCEAVRTGV